MKLQHWKPVQCSEAPFSEASTFSDAALPNQGGEAIHCICCRPVPMYESLGDIMKPFIQCPIKPVTNGDKPRAGELRLIHCSIHGPTQLTCGLTFSLNFIWVQLSLSIPIGYTLCIFHASIREATTKVASCSFKTHERLMYS